MPPVPLPKPHRQPLYKLYIRPRRKTPHRRARLVLSVIEAKARVTDDFACALENGFEGVRFGIRGCAAELCHGELFLQSGVEGMGVEHEAVQEVNAVG